MDFDVSKHMEGLPNTRERLAREIGTRTYEKANLSRLEDIYKLVMKKNLTQKERFNLDVSIQVLAHDIDHLNTSRLSILSSGGNAEILSRLVGSNILADFPYVKEVNYDSPEVVYEVEINGNKKSKEALVSLHVEFNRFRHEHEGVGGMIATVADFNFNKEMINNRQQRLEVELKVLRQALDKLD